ncbi:MAG: NCS2 family permease [Verrucomicrobiota bacterium JB025]
MNFLKKQMGERNTNLRSEVLGGVTTFATMAYIVVVNPLILSEAMGPEWTSALMVATCLSAALATVLMGLFTNYPIALAPGMGLNAYFAYTVVKQMGIPWEVGLSCVLLSGLLFVVLAFCRVQQFLVNAIPEGIRFGTAAGMGIFIAFIGLKSAGLVQGNPETLVTLGEYTRPPALLAMAGIVLIGALHVLNVRGSILVGIVAVTVAGMCFGVSPAPEGVVAMPEIPAGLMGQAVMHLPEAIEVGLVSIVLTMLFVDLLDTAGTLTGVGTAAGFMKPDGMPRAREAFLADGIGTSVGALLGTSTVTSYIESASGVEQGARSGVANYVTAGMFLLAIPFFPLASAIPVYATAPALIVVGVMMVAQTAHVKWDDMSESLPGVVAMIGIPLSFSIAHGLSLALLIHPLVLALGGRWREVHWMGWLMAGAVVLRYSVV